MKDLWQKWKVELIFRGAWNSLMAWPDWTWPPLFYDGTTPLSSVSKSLAPSAQAFSVSALPVCNFLSLSLFCLLRLALLSLKTGLFDTTYWKVWVCTITVLFSRTGGTVFTGLRCLATLPKVTKNLWWSTTRLKDPRRVWGWTNPWNVVHFPFSSVTLLVGWQEGHPVWKKLSVGLLVVTIWTELCTSYSSSCHHHLHHP